MVNLRRRTSRTSPCFLLSVISLLFLSAVLVFHSFGGFHWSRLNSPFGCEKKPEASLAPLAGNTLPGITTGSFNYTCMPYQSCWPGPSDWQAFNSSIGGNLKITTPWAEPCYENSSSAACSLVEGGYMSSTSRSSQYGAMEYLNWEVCGNSQCLLNSFSPSTKVSGTCSLGRLSAYYVEAHTAVDVSETLAFVKKHQIRLSIKNSGHDYFGRSNTANSLALWTHNMKDMAYHQNFTPFQCRAQYQNIGEIGAGVSAQEAYLFFESLGMQVTVGAIGSVGIAGGFGQGGGHGALAPSYGLMVDQAVEFEVVTADGHTRLINECNDPDLFWAMRGGGGGTYAVLTRYKFQLHPMVPINVYTFEADILPSSQVSDLTQSPVHRDIVTALARNQTTWSNNNVAGYNFILPTSLVSLQVLPSTNANRLKELTAQWHDFLSTYPGLNITVNSYITFPVFSQYALFTQEPSFARNGPVGIGLAEAGRLIPRTQFDSDAAIDTLVNAFLQGLQISNSLGAGPGSGSGQIYATGPSNQPDNSKTGVNPAWRGSLWEVIYGGIWVSADSQDTRGRIQNTISEAIKPLKVLTPGGGCYLNEGDWTEEEWQQTFFGENYGRLVEVKRMYDPSGLFNCWKCVGFNGYEDPFYSCYGQSSNPPNPTRSLGPVG
ncbi:FAD-binding domain-containing protein [Lepidopterella palustris CBS 459.81]|uniref:FAD-binding domain-containing protein n=1 Tax=Lepidopterella palustris CBS 459.81 TaxID=1314670 RepID=A0A8E2JFX2_9PEZI|nr:FAD-binding domain-containing protein [Lepidopterella palustris CBS 459.81]